MAKKVYLKPEVEVVDLFSDELICQFGISKFPKKLVISPLFCNLMVENQQLTNIYSDDYH